MTTRSPPFPVVAELVVEGGVEVDAAAFLEGRHVLAYLNGQASVEDIDELLPSWWY